MSERKTTEIKLRVSPDEKTSWQLAAEQEEIGLSEFARRAMNDRANHQTLGGLAGFAGDSSPRALDVLEAFLVEDDRRRGSSPEDEDSSVAQAVPTSGEADLVDALGPVIAAEVRGEDPKPWTFEARKSV